MTRPLFEPNENTDLAGHSWALSDLSKRALAGNWVRPVTSSPSPAWVPVYQNSWDSVSAPLVPFAFRRHRTGFLEFRGHLDASNATQGSVAFQLPGLGVGEPNYWDVDLGTQYLPWTLTPDGGTTFSPCLIKVDGTTLEASVTWGSAGVAVYEIKVFEDINVVVVGDGKFIWEIPEELGQSDIVKVEGFVTTAGGSSTQVQIRKVGGADILSVPITIDSGLKNSKDSGTQPAISGGSWSVAWGDQYSIDVDSAGSGAKGLGIIVALTPSPLGSVTVKGAKGDPGGVTAWRGEWNGGTAYTTGQSVSHNGSSYVATANSTGVEPGVTPGWQSSWQLLSAASPTSSLNATVSAGAYTIAPGLKGFKRMPYGGTISEVTLLADRAGNISIDIWKGDYGTHPVTSANSITGGTPPTLTGASKTTDVVLSGWTTSFSAGDIFYFNVLGTPSGVSVIDLEMKVVRA